VQGIEHTVEVSAESVYEAVAQALRVFREHEWCEDDPCNNAGSVLVRIRQPEVSIVSASAISRAGLKWPVAARLRWC
jgi:hypothetical protein